MENNGSLNSMERQPRIAFSLGHQWILESLFWANKNSEAFPNCASTGTFHGKFTWTEVPTGVRLTPYVPAGCYTSGC